MTFGCGRVKEGFGSANIFRRPGNGSPELDAITAAANVCSTIAGTYVNGRRLPLQGRGWGFESLRAYQLS